MNSQRNTQFTAARQAVWLGLLPSPTLLFTPPLRCLLRWIRCLFLAGFLIAKIPAAAASTTNTAPENGVTIIPQDGCNLVLADAQIPDRLAMRLSSSVHNWFAGTLTGLVTDRPTTVGFSMANNDTERNTADVRKWHGLIPVMTYADPTWYESYEWFQKDSQGRWMSGDPFKIGEAKFAGTGKVPEQSVITTALAEQFLSSDGKTWIPWRDVETATALPNINIFRIQQQFAYQTATVAMRVPYTYTYEQAFLTKLQDARLPGVAVDTIGFTPTGRKLYVIRMESPIQLDEAPVANRPTILVYAREHATEPDGSWVVDGILRWLLSDDPEARAAREQATWLLIPILDVDGSFQATFQVGDNFSPSPPVQREAVAYAKYLVGLVDRGYALELVVNLHEVECQEGQNIFSPMRSMRHKEVAQNFNQQLFARVKAAGYTVGAPKGWMVGLANARLAGWCAGCFHNMELMFEVNVCDPTSRLSLPRIQALGQLMAQECAQLLPSEGFAAIRADVRAHLGRRAEDKAAYWQRTGRNERQRTPYDLFVLGY